MSKIDEVTIDITEFERLLYNSLLLEELEKHGVERTEIYTEALESFRELKLEYDENKQRLHQRLKDLKRKRRNSVQRSYRYFRIMLGRYYRNTD